VLTPLNENGATNSGLSLADWNWENTSQEINFVGDDILLTMNNLTFSFTSDFNEGSGNSDLNVPDAFAFDEGSIDRQFNMKGMRLNHTTDSRFPANKEFPTGRYYFAEGQILQLSKNDGRVISVLPILVGDGLKYPKVPSSYSGIRNIDRVPGTDDWMIFGDFDQVLRSDFDDLGYTDSGPYYIKGMGHSWENI
jgi:hypothetical protein